MEISQMQKDLFGLLRCLEQLTDDDRIAIMLLVNTEEYAKQMGVWLIDNMNASLSDIIEYGLKITEDSRYADDDQGEE